MKKIIIVIIFLFALSACKDDKTIKAPAAENISSQQTTFLKDNNTDNLTDTAVNNHTESSIDSNIDNSTDTNANNSTDTNAEDNISNDSYDVDNTSDNQVEQENANETIIQLNDIDLEKLLANHYNTDVIQLIQKYYEQNHSYTALALSLEYSYLDIADELLKGIKPNNYLKSVIIDNLALSGNINNFKFLDKYNIKITDNSSVPANLFYMPSNKYLSYKMAEYLLENGVDVNSNNGFRTALSGAWNKQTIDLFLKYNADLDTVVLVTDKYCGTVVASFASQRKMNAAKYLLQKGANPFAPNDEAKEYRIVPDCVYYGDYASLDSLLGENEFVELADNEINEIKKAIKEYSTQFISDGSNNSSSKQLSLLDKEKLFPYTVQEFVEAINQIAYVDIDAVQNVEVLVNGQHTSIDTPYVSALLMKIYNSDNLKEDYVDPDEHVSIAQSYRYSVINSGADMEKVDEAGKNGLDYIISESKNMTEEEMINYASAYIYRNGQNKKEAVNNLMASLQKAGLQEKDSHYTKYIHKMYEKYNK